MRKLSMLKYSTVHFDNGINCKEWLGRAALPLLQFWTLPSQIIICSESYEKQAQKKTRQSRKLCTAGCRVLEWTSAILDLFSFCSAGRSTWLILQFCRNVMRYIQVILPVSVFVHVHLYYCIVSDLILFGVIWYHKSQNNAFAPFRKTRLKRIESVVTKTT